MPKRKPRVARIVLTPEQVEALVDTAQCYEGEGIADIAAQARAALPPVAPVRQTCVEVRRENARLVAELARVQRDCDRQLRALQEELEMSKRTRTIVPVPVKSMRQK